MSPEGALHFSSAISSLRISLLSPDADEAWTGWDGGSVAGVAVFFGGAGTAAFFASAGGAAGGKETAAGAVVEPPDFGAVSRGRAGGW
jgi:hypothetical protein